MGKCSFCGKDAGFFKYEHSACVQKHEEGLRRIERVIEFNFPRGSLGSVSAYEDLLGIEKTAKLHNISKEVLQQCIIAHWKPIVDVAVREETLSKTFLEFWKELEIQFDLASTEEYQRLQFAQLREKQEKTILSNEGLIKITGRIKRFLDNTCLKSDIEDDDSLQRIKKIATESHINSVELRKHVIEHWDRVVTKAVESENLSKHTVDTLEYFAKQFNLDKTDEDCHSTWQILDERIAIEAPGWAKKKKEYTEILVALKAGLPFAKIISPKDHPFKLQKSESLVWVFKNTSYFEEVSIKLTRAVIMDDSRLTEFLANNGMVRKDLGTMGLTTKHIYFVGAKEIFRIRYDRIGAYRVHQCGAIVVRYAKNARPQKFVTGEEFTYDLVTAIAHAY